MSHQQYESCIKACQACLLECEHCANACVQEGDSKELAPCIALDRDCAAICALAAEMMARNSPYVKEICKLCAQICRACGDKCSEHQHMEHCKRCAEICYQCATECEKMA